MYMYSILYIHLACINIHTWLRFLYKRKIRIKRKEDKYPADDDVEFRRRTSRAEGDRKENRRNGEGKTKREKKAKADCVIIVIKRCADDVLRRRKREEIKEKKKVE